MAHRIYDVTAKTDDVIEITFFTGEVKELSRQRLIAYGEKYRGIIEDSQLYRSAKVAEDHNSVNWGDSREHSISSNTLYSISSQVEKRYVDDIKVQLALSILNIRKEHELSQSELGNISGINQSDISKLERAEGNPSVDTITRLARAMDYSAKVEFAPTTDASELGNIRYNVNADPNRLVFFEDSDMCTREDIVKRSSGVRVELIHGKLRMCRELNRQERRILSYLYMLFYEHMERTASPMHILTGPIGILDNGPVFDKMSGQANNAYDGCTPKEVLRRRGLASSKRIKNNGQQYDYENYFEAQLVICSDDELADNLYMKQIPEFVLDLTNRENSDVDIAYKAEIYSRLGINEYWLLDVDRKRLHVYRFNKTRKPRRDKTEYQLWNDPENLLHDREILSYYEKIRSDNYRKNVELQEAARGINGKSKLYYFHDSVELNVFGDTFRIDLSELIRFLDKKD